MPSRDTNFYKQSSVLGSQSPAASRQWHSSAQLTLPLCRHSLSAGTKLYFRCDCWTKKHISQRDQQRFGRSWSSESPSTWVPNHRPLARGQRLFSNLDCRRRPSPTLPLGNANCQRSKGVAECGVLLKFCCEEKIRMSMTTSAKSRTEPKSLKSPGRGAV